MVGRPGLNAGAGVLASRLASAGALVVALVFAVLPRVPAPAPGTYPPLSVRYRIDKLTGSIEGDGPWVTQVFALDYRDPDHWTLEVIESNDPKPGARQPGELLAVDGTEVRKRPCSDCATDTRQRTNEALPAEVSPDVYVQFAANPTVTKTDAPSTLGLNEPTVSIELPAQYQCNGILTECTPGAAGQPPDLADAIATTVDTWHFVVFGTDSGVPTLHEVRIGDTLVYRYRAERLTVPTS